MTSTNSKKVKSSSKLDIHFDDGKVYELDQKLFDGEISFEEYCKRMEAMCKH